MRRKTIFLSCNNIARTPFKNQRCSCYYILGCHCRKLKNNNSLLVKINSVIDPKKNLMIYKNLPCITCRPHPLLYQSISQFTAITFYCLLIALEEGFSKADLDWILLSHCNHRILFYHCNHSLLPAWEKKRSNGRQVKFFKWNWYFHLLKASQW